MNFVFAGLGIIGYLVALAGLALIDAGADAAVEEGVIEEGASVGAYYLWVLVGFVSAGLLIAAGVGYLKQKKFGRTLGNAYGVLAILSTLIGLTAAGQSFGAMTLVGLVYPILTLILINTTFKENLAS